MTIPVRALSLPRSQPTRRSWVGFSLSVLCFLHCAGTAAVVPLLPAAFSLLIENELLEWTLLGVSTLLAGRLASRAGSAAPGWRAAQIVSCAAVRTPGITGLLLEVEALLQAALASLALLQLWVLLGNRRGCPHELPAGR